MILFDFFGSHTLIPPFSQPASPRRPLRRALQLPTLDIRINRRNRLDRNARLEPLLAVVAGILVRECKHFLGRGAGRYRSRARDLLQLDPHDADADVDDPHDAAQHAVRDLPALGPFGAPEHAGEPEAQSAVDDAQRQGDASEPEVDVHEEGDARYGGVDPVQLQERLDDEEGEDHETQHRVVLVELGFRERERMYVRRRGLLVIARKRRLGHRRKTHRVK